LRLNGDALKPRGKTGRAEGENRVSSQTPNQGVKQSVDLQVISGADEARDKFIPHKRILLFEGHETGEERYM